MELSFVDVAFVIAAAAFFKAQFGLEKRGAIVASFALALLLNFAPLVAQRLPDLSPWLEAFLSTIKVFLTASGSFDLAVDLFKKKAVVEAVVAESPVPEQV